MRDRLKADQGTIERETSAGHYLEHGLSEQARELRDEADILRAYLGDV